jgi:hypothetical protein
VDEIPTTTSYIYKANLAISGISAVNKFYDGNNIATITGVALIKAISGDNVSVIGNGNGLFNNQEIGANKPVIVTGYSLTGSDARNYNIFRPLWLTANINGTYPTPINYVISTPIRQELNFNVSIRELSAFPQPSNVSPLIIEQTQPTLSAQLDSSPDDSSKEDSKK